jgi:hypothetical protein
MAGNNGESGSTPGWVFSPREKILSVVIGFVLTGVEVMTGTITRAVLIPSRVLTSGFGTAGAEVRGAFADAGLAVLDVQRTVNSVVADVAGGTGLAGPIAATVLFVLAFVFTIALVRFGLWLLKWVT